MLKAVIFDLDDTLYEERDFFRSGFTAVGNWLAQRGVSTRGEVIKLLEGFHHREGRENVLQKLAHRLNFPLEWIDEMVTLIRAHEPKITLAEDTLSILPRLRKAYKLGCVTDGWSAVQKRKVLALGLESMLDAIVFTDDFGREYWKPHPFSFTRCSNALSVQASEAIFVGDNPSRDMLGARNAGMRSIRISRPGSYFAQTAIDDACIAPHCVVRNLYELEQVLQGWE